MNDAVKAQAEKVRAARKEENTLWFKQKDLEPRTPQWGAAVDELESATRRTQREESRLANEVLIELFGSASGY